MGDVELDWLCQVVARHCPAFFIHPSGRAAVCRARTILAVLYSFEVFEPEPRRLLAVCAAQAHSMGWLMRNKRTLLASEREGGRLRACLLPWVVL